ncbi:MAG: hypothetical protein P4M14_07295 [Gammaproteobacteria bacterium]|nr:hypothetical protein [Gammaproteobacteria bacterium]
MKELNKSQAADVSKAQDKKLDVKPDARKQGKLGAKLENRKSKSAGGSMG